MSAGTCEMSEADMQAIAKELLRLLEFRTEWVTHERAELRLVLATGVLATLHGKRIMDAEGRMPTAEELVSVMTHAPLVAHVAEAVLATSLKEALVARRSPS